MLIKPDKPPSQTTSYRPISLLSAIMKLFERVIEKRLRKHLEDNFFSKYQSGFRKSKSTNDHLFRLSQTIMESVNRGEDVIANTATWWSLFRCYKHLTIGWPMREVIFFILRHFSTTKVYLRGSNCLPKQMCPQLNKPFSPRLVVLLSSSAISASDVNIFFGQILVLSSLFSALP